MGIPILILGESGSGKSSSMRNFDPGEVGIFNVASKPLPFRTQLPHADNPGYQKIMAGLQKPKLKTYVIDDSQYLMVFDSFEKAQESGFGKFTVMAQNMYSLLRTIQTCTPPDILVYFLHHTDKTDDGRTRAKTLGKMLDNQLSFEGMFSVVLLCKTDGQSHWFETQSDGTTCVKSPMGMFDTQQIDNDLKLVDTKIREYWGLTAPQK